MVLQLVQPTDDKTLANLSMCLDERMKRRQVLLQDFQQRGNAAFILLVPCPSLLVCQNQHEFLGQV